MRLVDFHSTCRLLTAAAVAWMLAAGGCTAHRGVLARETKELARPQAFASGSVASLSRRVVVDAHDFTYAVAVTSAPAAFAYSHLTGEGFRLGFWEIDPEPRELADQKLNDVAFDVDALAFSPDGNRLAVASRDRTLKVFSRQGALLHAVRLDEPLTAVGWSRDGRVVAVGGAQGTLTAFAADGLRFGGEAAAHRDEVRAIAFDDKGRLYSGGWDRGIAVFEPLSSADEVREARVGFERMGSQVLLPVTTEGASRPLVFAFDPSAPRSALTLGSARELGIDPRALGDRAVVQTAHGPAQVALVRDRTLWFKALPAVGFELAVCDTCVPAGADGLLGADLLARFELTVDETARVVRIGLRQGEPGLPGVLRPQLRPLARWEYPLFVNDLSVDRAGRRLGVAFGGARAERTVEIYLREKRNVLEPVSDANIGAIVDTANGRMLRRFAAHQGVVATAAISPDGATLATGGWDRRLLVFAENRSKPVFDDRFGWSVRRARFSPDGRYLAVGSWTPQRPDGRTSDPAAVLYDVWYDALEVR